MAVVDYSSNFWGDKHIGYSVLYENMKKGEESVHELLTFLKERVNMEDDLFKSLGKSLHRVNGYISNNSGFVDAWKLAKETLELWTEIQSSTLRNLNDLLKEVARYQEELARMRKRAKDADTLETINLMQTTTTCLQKARDTFNQRSTDVVSLKQSNKEWTAASTKEYLRARNKLNKAHEEYKQYMDKYSQIRDTFEERVSQAARSFQEHDRLHLLQMKSFFTQMAKCLENAHGANAQVSATLRQRVEQNINVEQMMFRFIEEKGTGTEPPQKLQWTNADELPPELDVVSCVQSQSSSSNSSAIVPNFAGHQLQPNANHLFSLNDSWLTVGGGESVAAGGGESANSGGSIDGGFGESASSLGVKRGSINGCSEQNKSAGESDSERHLELPFSANPSSSVLSNFSAQNPSSSSSSSYVPQQISSWLGRQKFSGRLKKHFSTSQSNLAGPMAIEPFAVGESDQQTKNELIGSASNFSKSCNDPSIKTNSSAGLLKRYQKGKGLKRSMGDLTAIGKSSQSELAPISSLDQTEKELQKVLDPLEVFGPPPPLPSTEPPPLNDELVSTFSRFSADHVVTSSTTKGKVQQPILQSVSFVSTTSGGAVDDGRPNRRSASSSSSTTSDEEDICLAAQRSKIRQLQIRPLNDSQQTKLNASVDELRTAIGQISLPKCKGSESDPWGGGPTQSVTTQLPPGFFSNSHQEGPIRAALTGDEHLRRKYHELPLSDFSQSVASLSGATIARARPRSHTPLVPNPFGTPASFSPFVGSEPKEEDDNTPSPAHCLPGPSSHTSSVPSVPSSTNFDSASHSFGTPPPFSGGVGPFARNFSSASPMSSYPSVSSFSGSICKVSVPGTIPIAMAINEHLHVWFKSDAQLRPEVRLFGTLMFSLRGDSLDQLQSVESATMPLRFGLIGAEKLKIIGYNKMFLNGPNPPNPSLDTHRFVVERQNLCAFLQDCVRSCAQSSFFNADLLRYELPPELAPSPLPLLFSARLIRCENSTVDPNAIFELRVDYQWSEIGEKMPQNVAFNTKIATQSGHGVDVSLLSAEPPAKWVGEQCALSWEFRELLTTNGTLKATFKCSDGLLLANTYAQFQFSDTSLSGAQIHLDDHSGFVLSVFRKKLLSGKYFCEPSADR